MGNFPDGYEIRSCRMSEFTISLWPKKKERKKRSGIINIALYLLRSYTPNLFSLQYFPNTFFLFILPFPVGLFSSHFPYISSLYIFGTRFFWFTLTRINERVLFVQFLFWTKTSSPKSTLDPMTCDISFTRNREILSWFVMRICEKESLYNWTFTSRTYVFYLFFFFF